MTAVNPNANRAYGLSLLYVPGEPTIKACSVLATDSAVLGYQDAVKLVTLGAGKITVSRSAAGDNIDGVVVNPRNTGWQYTDTDRRRPASVLSTALIMLTGPQHIFSIMSSTTSYITSLANKYCDLATVANASSITGLSTTTIDVSTASSTSGQLYVLGNDDTYGNDVNDTAQQYAKIAVRIANT